ncbi:hypothetical protein [Streptococcus oricebi]|uniref:Lipoprotein n=1 Tax=Streptococcus oricebi TaxID=1547447 RepID=A0ABS5B2W5_9STRE|nr:hypothetical protein [Streptococcus oricebi]MBP2623173.1 hypothetical protein [Streptococcus oricebi]
MKKNIWQILKINILLLSLMVVTIFGSLFILKKLYRSQLPKTFEYMYSINSGNGQEIKEFMPLYGELGFGIRFTNKEYDNFIVGSSNIILKDYVLNYKERLYTEVSHYTLHIYPYKQMKYNYNKTSGLNKSQDINLIKLLKDKKLDINHIEISKSIYLENGQDVLEIKLGNEKTVYLNIDKQTISNRKPKSIYEHYDKELANLIKIADLSELPVDIDFGENFDGGFDGNPNITVAEEVIESRGMDERMEGLARKGGRFYLSKSKMSSKELVDLLLSFEVVEEPVLWKLKDSNLRPENPYITSYQEYQDLQKANKK